MDKIEKIRQEIERRRLHFNKEAEKYQAINNGYSQNCYGARDALHDLENFLDTLSEEPDKSVEEEAEVHSYGYDEDYLNEKIAKASKSWEGVDVDKFMDEVRGREPEIELEKELQKLDNAYFDLDGIAIAGTSYYLKVEDLKYIARHFYELGLNARKKEEL